jgi:hypothetical protein
MSANIKTTRRGVPVLLTALLLSLVLAVSQSVAAEVTFRVTSGAGVRAFEKTGDGYQQIAHFIPFKEHSLTRGDDDGGYEVYTFSIDAERFHCVAGGGNSGFVKTAEVVYLGAGDAQKTITIDAERLNPSRREDNSFKGDGVYFNVNDAQHLALNAGETFRLIPIRVWQAMEGFTDNYFIEPDYKIEVLGGADAVSQRWAGSPGLEYAEISAVKPGVAVIRVTYGPVFFKYEDGKGEYYNPTDPVNTGIVVVTVTDGEKNSGITTGIEAREYDTVYFDRDRADHAEYKFSPSGAGEPSVRVHRPIHAGGSEWGSGWSDGVKNQDGSFTVNLYNGRNIVETGFTGAAFREYHVINAKGIGISASNETNQAWKAGDPLNPGDRLRISFDGIKTPLEKIAGIYNPGWPDTCYVRYDSPQGGVRGEGVQYDLSANNAITVTVPESGRIELTNGVICCDHMGDPLDSHRTRPGHEPVYPNFSAINVKGVYSVMPDIAFVGGESDGSGTVPADGAASGGGGGCYAGAGMFALAALGAVILLGYHRRAMRAPTMANLFAREYKSGGQ